MTQRQWESREVLDQMTAVGKRLSSHGGGGVGRKAARWESQSEDSVMGEGAFGGPNLGDSGYGMDN